MTTVMVVAPTATAQRVSVGRPTTTKTMPILTVTVCHHDDLPGGLVSVAPQCWVNDSTTLVNTPRVNRCTANQRPPGSPPPGWPPPSRPRPLL